MNQKTIDLANIGLMVLSCALAYILPFELFLFSYAVLGPLHYLTEISWLHQRNYFATGKFDFLLFVILGAVITGLVLLGEGEEAQRWSTAIIFMSFGAALGMVIFNNLFYKIILLTFMAIFGYAIANLDGVQIAFGVFMPTLIHVFIFTGIFIVYGALKSKSATGILSAVVFIGCATLFFLYRPDFTWLPVSDYVKKSMMETKFVVPLASVIKLFHMDTVNINTVFTGNAAKAVMRFIAFAYTYHYLNWFSKTSVIKWHRVPAKYLVAVALLWLGSVALYAYNYRTGLEWLFLLSMLHVFMEFPLNFRSFIGIGEELKALLAGTPAAAPEAAPAVTKKSGSKKSR